VHQNSKSSRAHKTEPVLATGQSPSLSGSRIQQGQQSTRPQVNSLELARVKVRVRVSVRVRIRVRFTV